MWLALKSSRESLPLDELHLLLDEINSNVIGIKGSGVITITYGVVANVSFECVYKIVT